MAGAVVTITIALVFFVAVTAVLTMVAVAVRREDRGFTIGKEAPNRMFRRARRLNGLAYRDLDAEFRATERQLVH